MFDFRYRSETKMSRIWNPFEIEDEFSIKAFYSSFVRNCKHEYFFQGETHDFWEICYVIKGSVCMSVDDKVIKLCENQIIFHKPMEFHSLRTDSECPTSLFITSFSVDGDFIQFFCDKIFTLNHTQKNDIFTIINYLRNSGEYINDDKISVRYLEYLSKIPNGIKTLRNYVENLLISLSDTNATRVQLVKNTETDIYADALRIINDFVYDKLTVDELAKKCNVSTAYLKKIFAKYNGLGIHEYILQNKISIAKQMLSDGESVTNIADILGFSSQNYFSTAFKRETGVSPSNYIIV